MAKSNFIYLSKIESFDVTRFDQNTNLLPIGLATNQHIFAFPFCHFNKLVIFREKNLRSKFPFYNSSNPLHIFRNLLREDN